MSTSTIQLPQFHINLKCEDRIHCATCRSDRAWRANHCEFDAPPDGRIDWACPAGVLWPAGYELTEDPAPPVKPRVRVRKSADDVDGRLPIPWHHLVAWTAWKERWVPGPGDAIRWLANRAGFFETPGGGCGCKARQCALNSRGWRWCLRTAATVRPLWRAFSQACAELGVSRRRAMWRGACGLLWPQSRWEPGRATNDASLNAG
jgi:hypothetical protein